MVERTLPEDSVGLSFEGSQGGCTPAGIAISGISVSSITGPTGTGVDVGLVGTGCGGICQSMRLSCWGAKGVFRSSSTSRSCS